MYGPHKAAAWVLLSGLVMAIMFCVLSLKAPDESTDKPKEEPPKPLSVDDCYYTGGDFGGTPDIIYCVQASGRDGFLRCQGSTFPDGTWSWYSCESAEQWSWFSRPHRTPTKVECPTKCPPYKKGKQ